MAFGDYWKAVSTEDYPVILDWLNQHDAGEGADIGAVDVAYLLFGEKYGAKIGLVEYFEYDLLLDEETEEQYYIDEEGERIYEGDFEGMIYQGYRYLDSDFSDDTIEYVPVTDDRIWKQANDLAQNDWSYAFDLKPSAEDITWDEYQEHLAEHDYPHFPYHPTILEEEDQ
ncbi:hypothetical protein [Lactococcus allomyrinae]|uniref:Uncharacterized protein n=1 Tax=Lactococcus allomyrinae TaxID=2419773 RepID=A0A387BBJ8_9LACT|nr:hypothetical protein [Lactococcus allomyrinae]AYG01133.1 hypothetical protein D7I46_08520 [Lactococcus allomyrinae]